MDQKLKQYFVVTGCYWAFTLTDGALRMLVVLYFHQLGYSPLEVASLFLLYEFFGIVTNLYGGWLAANKGLNLTLKMGLALQIVALGMLMVPEEWLGVFYVMCAQALSGIAKDLNKMSAKSSIKLLVPEDAQGKLYRWVARLTGSKNALKGIGFFLGAALLSWVGFQGALGVMAAALTIVLVLSLWFLAGEEGKKSYKPKFKELLSKSQRINVLSGARFFLFGARDIWFVVALPVFLQTQLAWEHVEVGTMMASWVIAYGIVQTLAPAITGLKSDSQSKNELAPSGRSAFYWALPLMLITAAMAGTDYASGLDSTMVVVGLLAFGAVFAINSSIHSYLIVAYAKEDGVSLDVGFYYMANAAGRLIGTLLSGFLFQQYGFAICLLGSAIFILATSMLSYFLPQEH